MKQGEKIYVIKGGNLCLNQEKGRNLVLNEGFSQKEKAEEGGVPA